MEVLDGNLVSKNGKILVYSIENFINNICLKDVCFICGEKEDKKEFNDEHIIPRWLLKRYNLFGLNISLPNGKKFRYGKYKIRCCKDCNSLLGNEVEKKVANGFSEDYEKSLLFFNENKNLIFMWICLLFTKTHLRDKKFSYNFKSDHKISDIYEWKSLHHIHCIARTTYTGIEIDPSVFGTMFVFPCKKDVPFEKFDYADLYFGATVFVRLGNICIISVLNDSGMVKKILNKGYYENITGSINIIQQRELLARIAYSNMRISDRHQYFTGVNKKNNEVKINTIFKKTTEIKSIDKEEFGDLMYSLINDLLLKTENNLLSKVMSNQTEAVKKGLWTYLFDENGDFIDEYVNVVDNEDEFILSLDENSNILKQKT